MSCNKSDTIDRIKQNIKGEYEWLSDEDVQKTYNMALGDYLLIKYPSDNNRPSVDEVVLDFVAVQWLYKRMVDILGRAGGINVTSYKENGLSWTYAGSNIDPVLVAEIMPKASVPR